MDRKGNNLRKDFKSRASLARSKSELSYKERLKKATKNKKLSDFDLGAPADSAGYITVY